MSVENPQMNGNAAALRKALEFIKHASDDYEQYANTLGGALDVIYEKACAALAEPARNCDVGTLEEQIERHDSYCVSGVHCTYTCRRCYAQWAQMPYTEGSAK